MFIFLLRINHHITTVLKGNALQTVMAKVERYLFNNNINCIILLYYFKECCQQFSFLIKLLGICIQNSSSLLQKSVLFYDSELFSKIIGKCQKQFSLYFVGEQNFFRAEIIILIIVARDIC